MSSIQKIAPHFQKFCVWRLGPPRNGKCRKIPLSPITGVPARTNKPETFGTYEQASTAALNDSTLMGIGVLMASGGDTVIVDIDDCLDAGGKPDALAEAAIAIFAGTYCEVSQSGRGLHFVMHAVLPAGLSREKVTYDGHSLEIYSKAATRFLCITGQELYEAEVSECTVALETFIQKFEFCAGVNTPGEAPATDADTDDEHDDEEILKLLRIRNKKGRITRLMAGNLSDHNGDHSAADLAFLGELAYYTRDKEQIVRLFETSKLVREKWHRDDYRERTVDLALAGCKGFFWDTVKQAGSGSVNKSATVQIEASVRYDDLLSGGIAALKLTPKGRIASTVGNALRVMAQAHQTMGRIAYNEFGGTIVISAPLRDLFGGIAPTEVSAFHEDHLIHIRGWLNDKFDMSFGHDDALRLMIAVAQSNKVNPVRDALDIAHAGWDGVCRLDDALATYFNVDISENPEYHRAVLKAWMISAVARAYDPGCKADHVLVLEGNQGAGKSSAVKALVDAVAPDYFAEGLPLISGGNEVKLALRGKWVIELAELGAVRKADIEQVKAFLSATSDLLRVPYGKMFETWLRRAVFIGTANNAEYIADDSGGRRFWGVRCGRINVDAITRDALMLWAEAVHLYRAGHAWHLVDSQTIRQATVQQAARMLTDSWDDAIREFMDRKFVDWKALDQSWQIVELFEAVFPNSRMTTTPQDFDQIKKNRFSTCLRRAGWKTKKSMGLNRWCLADDKRAEIETSEAYMSVNPSRNGGFSLGQPVAKEKVLAISSAPGLR